MGWIMARPKPHLVAIALLALALATAAGSRTLAQNATPTPGAMSATEVIQKVGPAVVTVVNEQQVSNAPQSGGATQLEPVGSGSGFFIDQQGHVVTNDHVVAGGQQFFVIYDDGTKVAAKLIGTDPLRDLAVVQVSGQVPGTVPFGDSTQLLPGQPVIAMGSPLGVFNNTVTEGVVSGLRRSLPQSESQSGTPPAGGASLGDNQADYTDLIQHDAPINPGNSGGPLLNLSGEVVGVNTLSIPEAEQGVPAQGLNFAIPANTVKQIVAELIASGKVDYGFLGVDDPIGIDPVSAAESDLPVDQGVFVSAVVSGGPAATAGIQANDILTEFNGQPINQQHPLEVYLLNNKPGTSVKLTVLSPTQQQPQQVTVTLGSRPSGTSAL